MIKYMDIREDLLRGGFEFISDETLRQLFMSYKVCVQHLNALRAELEAMKKEGRADSLLYRDRSFSLAAEWNEVFLFELFFENIKAQEQSFSGTLSKAISIQWGSIDEFLLDVRHLAQGRCAKWVSLSFEPYCGQLYLNQIDSRGTGILAHHSILLSLYVAESSYCRDFGAHAKSQYVKKLLDNLDWQVIQFRYDRAIEGKLPLRR